MTNKLSLVDVGKLNEILNYIKKSDSEQDILRGATDTPEKIELLES